MVKHRFDLTIQLKQLRFVKKRLTPILPLNLKVINFLLPISCSCIRYRSFVQNILFQGQGASYNIITIMCILYRGSVQTLKSSLAGTCLSDILSSIYLIFHFIYSSEAPETAVKIVKETPKAYTEFAI